MAIVAETVTCPWEGWKVRLGSHQLPAMKEQNPFTRVGKRGMNWSGCVIPLTGGRHAAAFESWRLSERYEERVYFIELVVCDGPITARQRD
jgi:hypothetical protein